MAADRVPRTSAVSGIGLGASLLVIFGLFLHRIGQTPGTNGGDNPLSNATSAMKSRRVKQRSRRPADIRRRRSCTARLPRSHRPFFGTEHDRTV